MSGGGSVELTLGGRPPVAVPAGADGLSDPVALRFAAFETLAGKPTEYSTARRMSCLTREDAGDRVANEDGRAFTVRTTARPFVTGLDVRAPRSQSAVPAFGDSITGGSQGQPPAGVPQTQEGIDAGGRYPDMLARRPAAVAR